MFSVKCVELVKIMTILYLYDFNLRKREDGACKSLSMWAGVPGDNIRNVASFFSFQEQGPESWDSGFHLTHGELPWM